MNHVKRFLFPSFEEWIKKESWTGTVKDFTCKIAAVCWCPDKIVYEVAISTSSNPCNMYVPKVYCESFTHDRREDLGALRNWYELITVHANNAFDAYIKSYFVEDLEEEV